MVAINVVGHLRHQNDQNSNRHRLTHEVTQDFPLRLLPALLNLPLEIADRAGSPRTLAETIRADLHITLAGASGSGRRLALQQWALTWAAGAAPDTPAPTLLALTRVDDGVSAPERLLAAFQPSDTPPVERQQLLPFFRRAAPPASARRGLLLIHGWDELAADRRALWRSALLDVAQNNPAIQLVVALPNTEPSWPRFTPLTLMPAAPALVTRWVEHLTPAAQRTALLEALVPNGQLHPLGARLFEVALLAWVLPQAGLHPTRGALYAQALATLLELPVDGLDRAPIVQELQLLAAYDERPARIATRLLELDGAGAPRFIHPQIGRYMAARQIIAEQRYDLLQLLDAAERAELALAITTMLDDPEPLYKALWAEGQISAADTLTLGYCLRERAPHNPVWTLRVIGMLTRLANDETSSVRAQALQLLHAGLAALDVSLDALAGADDAIQRFLMRLFDMLPADLAAPRMFRLIYNPEVAERFAWLLADRVIGQGHADQTDWIPPVVVAPVLARWIYIRVLQNTAAHHQIDPAIATSALSALATSAAGETRKLHVAARLLDDAAQAVVTRQAALALLAESTQPAALTVIERASNDSNSDIRGSALEALSRYDPERACVALGRAATDDSAPWDLRLEAIGALGHHLAIGAGRTLERCVGDAGLPLYVRLQAIGALGHGREGMPHLLQILGDAHAHVELRAAAARQLGIASHQPASATLIALIENPSSASALAIGCCASLGLLHDRAASGPLLRLLERAAADVELTLAAAHALGQIGDPETCEPLSHLLGAEALQRLQRDLTPAMLQQPPEACQDDPALPTPIALRVATVLATSVIAEARPTSLGEFLGSEADRVRAASAHALAAIGGNGARAALLAALLDGVTGGATGDVIDALANVEGPESADALGYVLDTTTVDPLTRWLVVRHLTEHPGGEDLMRRALVRATTDPFTRGALAEGLGQRGAIADLPVLRYLAEDRDADQQLRAQALLGIGLLNDPSAETALIRMIGDTQELLVLRGLAAEYLPAQLSAEGRRALREMLRNERPPVPIVVGALRTLGRVRDREALPLMLRYSQDENAEITQATIAALTDLGDGSVAPMLVRLAHHTAADHALRLQASGALLRIGGDGYRPLLRVYLDQGPLPLRLLAMEYLIDAGTATADLLVMLADQAWPHTLRLRLVEHLAENPAAAQVLSSILEAEDDDIQLRALAAEALGRMRYEPAIPALARLAEDSAAAETLRMRCIGALQRIGTIAVWATISRLAEDAAQPPALRQRAIEALRPAI